MTNAVGRDSKAREGLNNLKSNDFACMVANLTREREQEDPRVALWITAVGMDSKERHLLSRRPDVKGTVNFALASCKSCFKDR